MRAARLADSVNGTLVVQEDAPEPRPGRGEVLIRVCAAGVTKTELRWEPTLRTKTGDRRRDAIPAHEFSGVVAAVGEGVSGIAAGQEVFGMNDWYSDGALAEFCVAPAADVAPKPRSSTHLEAASVPIGALTAWQGLFDHARLQPGERVLVHGGAGGVGIFATQLAKLNGARVIATASARNADFVKGLGAEQVIDYHASRFEDCVQDVDVVFDTVGIETVERSWNVLNPRGRMVTIVSDLPPAVGQRIKDAFFIVEPNRKQLMEIGDLLETKHLRTVVDAVIPLSRAPEAYQGKVEGEGRGKLVIAVGGLG